MITGGFDMIEPYLNFNGRAAEAISFYESVFNGTDKLVMRYSDMPAHPDYPIPEHMKDRISHATMVIDGTLFHFSDMQENPPQDSMISLVVHTNTPEEINVLYHKLSDGGQVLMELSPQFFAKMYGWVKDRFGINWQIFCE